ncbi:MAG: transglycosylase domain-containing protein [Alphaproteobacteria bacterium]|nr:transglycosylase domain-containing protein [Alphaproteobacteria bacterium]MCB9692520.1 transglycosylase domain-containing protein [Alphaproteobacteria bacterium]
MPLNLPCPECGAKIALSEPFPQPGSQLKCTTCGRGLAVSYPDGVVEQLRSRGKRFVGERRAVPDPAAHPVDAPRVPSAPPPPPPGRRREPPPTQATEVLGDRVSTEAATAARTEAGGFEGGTVAEGTVVDGTEVAPEAFGEEEFDRTVPSARSPYGGLAGNVEEPESRRDVGPAENEPTRRFVDKGGTEAPTEQQQARRRPDSEATGRARAGREVTERTERQALAKQPKKGRKRGVLGCLGGFGTMGCGSAVAAVVLGLAGIGGGYWYYSKDLPTVEALREYTPATVTTVLDKDGRLLGEIYEQRRYVLPLEEIPKHVQMAFVSAEDATFFEHGGVNYMGIVRAIGRSFTSGSSPKGTSTITQQVAKNFLLTNEHSITRKIKEAILSWRIEDTYDKEHILFLYLNEIYLGSQAYGVEAGARTYFGKSVKDLTHGEAALLAGLPPRPSGYSPHRSWESARKRQEYVVAQMVEKGHLTAAEGKAALAEKITIIPRGNTFLEQAPHFTEHARRFLVDRYGEEKVLNQGLQVTTTCDLDLQKLGQDAVTDGIFEVDQRMGFRRAALAGTVGSDSEIAKVRKEHEMGMRAAQGTLEDAAKGRSPLPSKSTLEVGQVYKAVVLEVDKGWVRIGIGDHEAVIPVAWADWAYQPDPKRSWRFRDQADLTTKYDWDDDGTKDHAVLERGDVILAKVASLSTLTSDDETLAKELPKAFKGTPGEKSALVAARLWQVPEVEGALLSMDLHTGAVRTMVGGADFTRSQLNRTVQSRRQVGSTFKPIVYAAAIESKKVTAATIVPDAPMAKATTTDFVWKPGNYGNDYLGNITLRKALAMSRNTCTVRVLEATDPSMENDVIYEFGRRLGIGGIPLYRLPPDHRITPETDQLCPWVEVPEDHGCKDTVPKGPGTKLCRSCDMSMALGSASITMEEMVRAYSAFATGGKLIEPYYVTEVKDRDGKVLFAHEAPVPPQVLEPEVAAITTWLLQNVVQGGTAAAANRLGLKALAGKTGTTNDEKDAWFIGFTNDVITAVWVGFDQPAPLGVSSTGGRTALPIWMDYMEVAAPKDKDRPFPMWGDVQSALIDEDTGRRVESGGRPYPFLAGTVPESTGVAADQITVGELMTEL